MKVKIMSFKEWSTAQTAVAKEKANGKPDSAHDAIKAPSKAPATTTDTHKAFSGYVQKG